MFVLASAFFFGAHIIALSKWSSGRDAYAMTIVQLSVCALLSGLASIPDGYALPPDNGVWGVVIFTAVFATAIAFIVQTWSQAHMSATKVAVILTMEASKGVTTTYSPVINPVIAAPVRANPNVWAM